MNLEWVHLVANSLQLTLNWTHLQLSSHLGLCSFPWERYSTFIDLLFYLVQCSSTWYNTGRFLIHHLEAFSSLSWFFFPFRTSIVCKLREHTGRKTAHTPPPSVNGRSAFSKMLLSTHLVHTPKPFPPCASFYQTVLTYNNNDTIMTQPLIIG